MNGGSRLSKSLLSEDVLDAMRPERTTPSVGYGPSGLTELDVQAFVRLWGTGRIPRVGERTIGGESVADALAALPERLAAEFKRRASFDRVVLNRLHILENEVRQVCEDLATLKGTGAVTYLIYDLEAEGFEVLKPIPVLIEWSPDGATASQLECLEYGSGDTDAEAIGALKENIVDLYRDLEANEDALAPGLARVWRWLKSVIVKRSG